MGDDEIDYVTCINCDTPCYVFDIGADGRVASAFCSECGNDEPTEFSIPGQESQPAEEKKENKEKKE